VINPKELIILGINPFKGNPHDSRTIEPLLDQMDENLGYLPKEVVYDRGDRVRAKIKGVHISTTKPPLKRDNRYARIKKGESSGVKQPLNQLSVT